MEKDTDTLQKYLLAGYSSVLRVKKSFVCRLLGFPPDQSDPITRTTALHVAVESGNIRAIQVLLQAGAQVNLCDASVSTPLHIAAYLGYEEVSLMILR